MEKARPNKDLKGIGGWLMFLIISFIFIRPLYTIFDIAANPQFYFYESGVISPSSLVIILGFIVWSIIVGIALWSKKEKAVIWAKEYLIAELVINIFFSIYSYGLYSSEDYGLIIYDLFRGVIYFAIWFSYLNVSERVKNTFKEREINWKRVLAISAIALAGVFVVSTLISFLYPVDIENESQTINSKPTEDTLAAGYVQYYAFSNPLIQNDVNIDFDSSGTVDIYLVKSDEDYDKFIANEDFDVYSGCFKEGRYSGNIRCTVSSGGVLIYNPNDWSVTYTLKFNP